MAEIDLRNLPQDVINTLIHAGLEYTTPPRSEAVEQLLDELYAVRIDRTLEQHPLSDEQPLTYEDPDK